MTIKEKQKPNGIIHNDSKTHKFNREALLLSLINHSVQ